MWHVFVNFAFLYIAKSCDIRKYVLTDCSLQWINLLFCINDACGCLTLLLCMVVSGAWVALTTVHNCWWHDYVYKLLLIHKLCCRIPYFSSEFERLNQATTGDKRLWSCQHKTVGLLEAIMRNNDFKKLPALMIHCIMWKYVCSLQVTINILTIVRMYFSDVAWLHNIEECETRKKNGYCR